MRMQYSWMALFETLKPICHVAISVHEVKLSFDCKSSMHIRIRWQSHMAIERKFLNVCSYTYKKVRYAKACHGDHIFQVSSVCWQIPPVATVLLYKIYVYE